MKKENKNKRTKGKKRKKRLNKSQYLWWRRREIKAPDVGSNLQKTIQVVAKPKTNNADAAAWVDRKLCRTVKSGDSKGKGRNKNRVRLSGLTYLDETTAKK